MNSCSARKRQPSFFLGLEQYTWRVAKLLVPAFCILNTPLIAHYLKSNYFIFIYLFIYLFIDNFILKMNQTYAFLFLEQ
jgi:hypothetical protein